MAANSKHVHTSAASSRARRTKAKYKVDAQLKTTCNPVVAKPKRSQATNQREHF